MRRVLVVVVLVVFIPVFLSPVQAGAVPLIEDVYAVPSVLGPAGGTVTVLGWETSFGPATCQLRFDGTSLRRHPPPSLAYSRGPAPLRRNSCRKGDHRGPAVERPPGTFLHAHGEKCPCVHEQGFLGGDGARPPVGRCRSAAPAARLQELVRVRPGGWPVHRRDGHVPGAARLCNGWLSGYVRGVGRRRRGR